MVVALRLSALQEQIALYRFPYCCQAAEFLCPTNGFLIHFYILASELMSW